MRKKNPVAKNMNRLNKAKVIPDKRDKKYEKVLDDMMKNAEKVQQEYADQYDDAYWERFRK